MRSAAARVVCALCALATAMPVRVAPVAAEPARAWAVPVLMYHRVDTALAARDPITVHLTVMAPAFAAQLRLLKARGFRAITLDELWAGVARHAAEPARAIVLTFDDGYEDNYTVAFPLLRRYGFTATFFVVTSTVGTPGHLTAAQIRAMAGTGMSIESHGEHHVDFSELPLGAARHELAGSREIISRWSGRPVAFFAYPAGRYSPALEHVLAALGYRGAATEVPGFVTPASNPYALERVRVDHYDTLRVFARKLGLPAP